MLAEQEKPSMVSQFQALVPASFSFTTIPCSVQLSHEEEFTKKIDRKKSIDVSLNESFSITSIGEAPSVNNKEENFKSIDDDVFDDIDDVFQRNYKGELIYKCDKEFGRYSTSLELEDSQPDISKVVEDFPRSKVLEQESIASINEEPIKTFPKKRPLTRQKRITHFDLSDSCGSNDSINSAPQRRRQVKKLQSDSVLQYSPKPGEGRRRRAGSFPFTSQRESIANITTNIEGNIEFSVLFQEDNSLTVDIMRMRDTQILPVHFLGTLDLFSKEEEHKLTKVCLVNDEEGHIALHTELPMGLMIHVTLLPTNKLQEHTKLILESHNPCFNETFTAHDVSMMDRASGILCLQVVCVFGNSHELVVLGEVKVRLKGMKLSMPTHLIETIGPVTHELPLKVMRLSNST